MTSVIPHLIELQETESTNDHAKSLAREGAVEGTIVWTHRQTAGRGRQGNAWVSFDGNLYMTLILRPEGRAGQMGQLSFVAALALAETLKPFLPPQAVVSLKWPNDLLLNGKKAAGILLETEGDKNNWVVIGMGVNVEASPDGATSMRSLGATADKKEVMEKLYTKLMSLYGLWQEMGFTPIRQEWLGYAINIGNVINIRLPGETFSARFLGLDDGGALQVEMDDGSRRTIASGEVFAL